MLEIHWLDNYKIKDMQRSIYRLYRRDKIHGFLADVFLQETKTFVIEHVANGCNDRKREKLLSYISYCRSHKKLKGRRTKTAYRGRFSINKTYFQRTTCWIQNTNHWSCHSHELFQFSQPSLQKPLIKTSNNPSYRLNFYITLGLTYHISSYTHFIDFPVHLHDFTWFH